MANAHDEPGRFTALIGYEFSSLLRDMGMLHRNVIFRGSEVIPRAISALDVRNQREFFDQLDEACVAPCEVLTIPHNTNYSWGLTFSRKDEDGSAYTSKDLERRARIERLFEVTQMKEIRSVRSASARLTRTAMSATYSRPARRRARGGARAKIRCCEIYCLMGLRLKARLGSTPISWES